MSAIFPLKVSPYTSVQGLSTCRKTRPALLSLATFPSLSEEFPLFVSQTWSNYVKSQIACNECKELRWKETILLTIFPPLISLVSVKIDVCFS